MLEIYYNNPVLFHLLLGGGSCAAWILGIYLWCRYIVSCANTWHYGLSVVGAILVLYQVYSALTGVEILPTYIVLFALLIADVFITLHSDAIDKKYKVGIVLVIPLLLIPVFFQASYCRSSCSWAVPSSIYLLGTYPLLLFLQYRSSIKEN